MGGGKVGERETGREGERGVKREQWRGCCSYGMCPKEYNKRATAALENRRHLRHFLPSKALHFDGKSATL